eukprot:CAMPEP_0201914472 /NCGR_PEP_ID=MMETSP0903-20130614/4646_1 /ASSEMBLY_ACC=CAM_ASM_000552 /TAXON_ID=420261 /ORGANISM="Thalassiosira antarctica, Strain CCMP982" /LENGTH=318 /DNA_ID=CAMNT_0048449857 /DNA_START=33 /DNA_END=989 /DNA_ORIENTATION=-
MTTTRIASVWSSTFIALLVLSAMQSVVLALSIPHFHSKAKYHCPAFTSCRQTHHHHSNVPQHHVVRSSALQLAASDDDKGGFFSDDSGGNFFEEVEKPPSQEKGEESPSSTLEKLEMFEEVEKPPPPQEKEEESPMPLEELEMLATPFDEHLPKINTVTLVGRVGNAPEPRYFDDGKVVLNLSLAVRRKYHPLERKVREIRSGDEETDWFTLEFWGRDAEYVTNYVKKGARLGVTGSLVMDGWVDKRTGEQRRKAKILVSQTDILESRAEAELRNSNKGSYDGNSGGKKYDGNTGGKKYDGDDDDSGPAPAGTGGFFS